MLGILVRTKHDSFTEISFRCAEEILQVSREKGHIFIDLAAAMATRENVVRILGGIGRPKDPPLKLVVFYCHGNERSPIDQTGEDFINDETLSSFAGWGVYCIGCDVGKTLGHRLLAAGSHFVIAFNARVSFVASQEEEIFAGLNLGVLEMLRDGIEPSTAVEHMRSFFEEHSDSAVKGPQDKYSWMRALCLFWNARSLAYYGGSVDTRITSDGKSVATDSTSETSSARTSEIAGRLSQIKHGQDQAHEYEELIAQILHAVFGPELDEPEIEVSNDSGSSRYEITFMNRAVKGFWHDIKVSRHNSVVIFDAKNKKQLDPSDADQMLRYSGPWRGDVIFIVCRNQPSNAFTLRAGDMLKEKGVCLIVLTDTELKTMLELKRRGEDPTIIVERLYRRRIDRS